MTNVLREGREGHWGLSGMRERAERIGARLRVLSRLAAGTEMELSVPGRIAFYLASSKGIKYWISNMLFEEEQRKGNPASKSEQLR